MTFPAGSQRVQKCHKSWVGHNIGWYRGNGYVHWVSVTLWMGHNIGRYRGNSFVHWVSVTLCVGHTIGWYRGNGFVHWVSVTLCSYCLKTQNCLCAYLISEYKFYIKPSGPADKSSLGNTTKSTQCKDAY